MCAACIVQGDLKCQLHRAAAGGQGSTMTGVRAVQMHYGKPAGGGGRVRMLMFVSFTHRDYG